jgi:hypothetical protein
MSSRWTFLALILPALGLAVAAAEPPAEQAKSESHADLSGHWKLNREKSDDPHAKMQDALRSHTAAAWVGRWAAVPWVAGRWAADGAGGPAWGLAAATTVARAWAEESGPTRSA